MPVRCSEVEDDQEDQHENVGGEYGARVPGLEVLATTMCFTCPTAAPMKKIDDTMIVLGGDAVAALFWVAAPGVALALVRSSD